MTKEKLKSVFQFYLIILNTESKRRVPFPTIPHHVHGEPARLSDHDMKVHFINPPLGELAHLRYMCLEGQKHVDAGKVEKAMRWLGFLQGVMWARGFYSLEDLKNHSRPDQENEHD